MLISRTDTIKLYRQLRRLGRRVRQRPEEEAARDYRAAGSEGSGTALANKVRRGDIRHAVVVRVKKELQRPDGSLVRFGDNACVLINKAGDPIGTRMNGVVGQELRGKQWSKILSLAPVHV
ncbi:50S ribosomal protein L14 [Penicillium malachiteum]|uniref:50S ribosomal protein L14 n=1 Tax=Penicillium malachiteum TaxID=1324776 RepID=UPI002549949F|nr:50S ribosomal protein L14 [Penicillium malachiteum]KAJ5730349.1 50S ribosomal protein L14 [Penicillium malachiteum]